MFSGEYDPYRRRFREAGAPDNLREIPQSRHPFQLALVMACMVGGAAELFGWAHIVSVNTALPKFFVIGWALLLFLGGVLALVGPFWYDRLTGLFLERVGVVAVGFGSAVYAVVLVGLGFSTAALVIAWAGGIAVASFVRVLDLNRELRKLADWIARVE